MRAVIQRCTRARVTVGERVTGEIGPGLLVLLGVAGKDTERDAAYLAEKTAHLRVFADQDGKMNLSVLEHLGPGRAEALVVSQFTLYGDCRRGRRPSYTEAAPPEEADRLYRVYVRELEALGVRVATGEFQAMMMVELVNDGPVTILLDSGKFF